MSTTGSRGRLPTDHTIRRSTPLLRITLALLLIGLLACPVHAGPPASMNDLMRSVKAQEELIADDQFRGLPVRVEIREGMAVLRGTVPSDEVAQRLVQKVQLMDGVTTVVKDRLKVEAPTTGAVGLPAETVRTAPVQTPKVPEAYAVVPSPRAEAGFPGVDPNRLLPQQPPMLARTGEPAPRPTTPPQLLAQGPTGPQVSTSLRTTLPPVINTTSEPAVRPDFSFDRVPQSETLPQVVARVRNSDTRFANVELRLDGTRLIVLADDTTVRRGVAMAFARELSRANPPGIESVRVANSR